MGWIEKYYRARSSLNGVAAGLALAGQLAYFTTQATAQSAPAASATAANPPVADSVDKDYSAELPRIPPKTPDEEYQSFDVLDGFEVELVAAEPLVVDPIAFAFDARYRLFVVEMCDYSEQETERLGSVALLVDSNGDGKYDKRSTFTSGLSWPTAIWPWRDGCLVAEPPKITWFRDTDGDGVSDRSEVWFEGFHRSNVQGLVNSLRWGVDGFIHGATSSSGADLQHTATGGDGIALRGRDFAIDPLTKSLTAENGGGQHGMSFNRWGAKFVTSNSDHLQQILELDAWLRRHPTSVALPSLRKSIAEDGPQAEVYRVSPVEPWRIVRTRLRMSGVAPGVVEGGGRAAGYFTGATGTCIMDAEAGFGVPGFDTAIVCDVGSNLVHRKQLRSNGLFYTANRIDANTELLRGKDIWFRPVQVGDGPDGALYIADMYREVIEHPKSLPPMIKKHLDLTSGRDRGRIWRLKPKGLSQKLPMPTKVLEQCSHAELVERLASPIAWQRRAASQLLVEQQANDVTAALAATTQGTSAEAAILTLHCLNRLQSLDDQVATAALRHANPHVISHTLALRPQLVKKWSDSLIGEQQLADVNVQLQLALAIAELEADQRQPLLKKLIATREPLIRSLVVSAAGDNSPALVAMVNRSDLRAWLQLMLPAWLSQLKNPPNTITTTLAKGLQDAETRSIWLDALRSLPSAADASRLLKLLPGEAVQATLQNVQQQIESAAKDPAVASDAVSWLGFLPIETQQQLADELLSINTPESLQLKAMDALLWSDAETATGVLMPRFQNMTPALQRAALGGLLRFRQSAAAIATALEAKTILASQVPPDLRTRLLDTNDAALKQRLGKLLTGVSADRAAVVAKFTSAVQGVDSDQPTDSGREVFTRVCAQCHRINNIGNDVGPPLKQLTEKSPQQLLEAILDPNREVDPKYASYSLLHSDGRVFAGIITEESSAQIVLSEAGGKQHTIARSDVQQLRSTGASLMPVGLEQQITPAQMVELIRFLKKGK